MFNKKLVKEAHRLAREIKIEYPEVDYRFQFGICMKYLLSEREVEEVVIKTSSSNYELKNFENVKLGKDRTIELPTVVVADYESKVLRDEFSLDYTVWQKYGKERIYVSVCGKRAYAYIDVTNKAVEGKGKAIAALYWAVKNGQIKMA